MLGIPLGRLPGDTVYWREGVTVYFPIVTSLLVSLILTLAVMMARG